MLAGRSRFVAFLPVLWICLVAPPSTAADVVRLDNGDRLTGEIVSLADGRLRLDTEWAGEIEIGWSAVRSIASDGVLTLELDDGSRLIGRVSAPAPEAGSPDAGAALVHPEGLESPVRLALDRLQAINPPEGGVRFTGSASAGLVTHRGNTETRSLYFEADATTQVSFDYDGDPAPGREKEDWRYLVNLGVEW